MKRLVSAIIFDMKFQFRHGFYGVYLLFTILYLVVLRLLPQDIRLPAAVIIVLSDPAILGFFLIGAIVMLERGQHLYSGLFSTPLRTGEYLAAKAISLGAISLASSLAIFLIGGFMVNLWTIIPGIFLTASFFTLVGFSPALKFKSLPTFLILAPVYITAFFLPIPFYLGLSESPFFYLLPTTGSLFLIGGSITGMSGGQIIYSFSILCLWVLAAWHMAKWVLGKQILGGGGRSEEN